MARTTRKQINRLDFIEPQFLPVTARESLGNQSVKSDREDLRSAMDHFEKQYLAQALVENRYTRKKTADRLGIDRKTLLRKMKKHRLS